MTNYSEKMPIRLLQEFNLYHFAASVCLHFDACHFEIAGNCLFITSDCSWSWIISALIISDLIILYGIYSSNWIYILAYHKYLQGWQACVPQGYVSGPKRSGLCLLLFFALCCSVSCVVLCLVLFCVQCCSVFSLVLSPVFF